MTSRKTPAPAPATESPATESPADVLRDAIATVEPLAAINAVCAVHYGDRNESMTRALLDACSPMERARALFVRSYDDKGQGTYSIAGFTLKTVLTDKGWKTDGWAARSEDKRGITRELWNGSKRYGATSLSERTTNTTIQGRYRDTEESAFVEGMKSLRLIIADILTDRDIVFGDKTTPATVRAENKHLVEIVAAKESDNDQLRAENAQLRARVERLAALVEGTGPVPTLTSDPE